MPGRPGGKSHRGEEANGGDSSKWHAIDSSTSAFDAALVAQATLETGDDDDLLGSGSNAFFLGAVAAATSARSTPISTSVTNISPTSRRQAFSTSIGRICAPSPGSTSRLATTSRSRRSCLGRWREDGLDLYDMALGAKWASLGDVPISANIVVPLNRNKGLRSDFYFTVGIESTF